MPLKLGFAVPAYGSNIDAGHIAMWMSLGAMMAYNEEQFVLADLQAPSVSNVDLARNKILSRGIKAGCDWLVMVDADTFHDGGADILRMVKTGHERQCAMIGAPVRCKSTGVANVMKKRNGGIDHVLIEEIKGVVTEVDRVGSAVIAINVPWIKEHWPRSPWFATVHFDRGLDDEPGVMGEDFFFCDMARDKGGLILCDGRFNPDHTTARGLLPKLFEIDP